MMIVAVTGVAIDISKHYAVRAQLQSSLDAALIGGVRSRIQNPDVKSEVQSLFFANYPRAPGGYDAWYMGTTINNLDVYENITSEAINDAMSSANSPQVVTPVGRKTKGEYSATVSVRSPNSFMQIFGRPYETITASASAIYNEEQIQKKAEISFVLDTTGSMCIPNCAALNSLKLGMNEALNTLFGTLNTLEHVYINIIPYSTAVVFDTTRIPNAVNWVQSAWAERVNWQLWVGPQIGHPNRIFLSNRNPDMPPDTAYSDTTDALPTSDFNKFRTPIAKSGAITGTLSQFPTVPFVEGFGQSINGPWGPYVPYWGWDEETYGQQAAIFHSQEKAALVTAVDGLQAVGYTRIPSGALWGMLALSPTWRGMLNSAQPNVPLAYNVNNLKFMVLMTDGENSVFSGQVPYPPATQNSSDDDTTTRAVCTAAKGRGVRIFTIGLGASIDQQLLIDCATAPTDFYLAPTPGALVPIFQNIAEQISDAVDPARLTR